MFRISVIIQLTEVNCIDSKHFPAECCLFNLMKHLISEIEKIGIIT